MQRDLQWHLSWHSVSAAPVELPLKPPAIQLGMQARNTMAGRRLATTGSTTLQTGGRRATTLQPAAAQLVAASLGHRRVPAAVPRHRAAAPAPHLAVALPPVPAATPLGVRARLTPVDRRPAITASTTRLRIGHREIIRRPAMGLRAAVSLGFPMEAARVALRVDPAVDRQRLRPAQRLHPARLDTCMLRTSI